MEDSANNTCAFPWLRAARTWQHAGGAARSSISAVAESARVRTCRTALVNQVLGLVRRLENSTPEQASASPQALAASLDAAIERFHADLGPLRTN